jgi:aryl-alcohol dehydrogenase-like predicted oxidoreductase
MEYRLLGRSGLKVSTLTIGTMTFGGKGWAKTVGDLGLSDARRLVDLCLDAGVNLIDTADVYSQGVSEDIIGEITGGKRKNGVLIATKARFPMGDGPNDAGSSRHHLIRACEASLKRLKTDVIDLYQVHWPERHVPSFGRIYYDPALETSQTPLLAQLQALDTLVRQGKVRHIGLSNETPYGVHEFVRLAEQHGLARVATVQNAYCLLNRGVENALDETMHRLDVSLLAYSPLAFGLLTGKYDQSGIDGPHAPAQARLPKFESMRRQRWGRPEAVAAARRYNQLARDHGLTPTQLALGFCHSKWQVASTIIGVTSLAQLDENVDAWGTRLSLELLAKIDALRWELRDLAA